jgi:hypothetical protein
VRPALATGALFAGASALGAAAHVGSWLTLVLSVGVSAGVVAALAFFAGLPTDTRQLLWHRFRKVVRLT